MRTLAQPRFRALERPDIDPLLARNHVGRIAYGRGDRIDVEPIHYVHAHGWIYGRTSRGAKYATVGETWLGWWPVAFEVDEVEDLFRWRSVVVHGGFYGVDPELDREVRAHAVELLRTLLPEMLAADDPVPFRDVVFRIAVQEVTGREAYVAEPADAVRSGGAALDGRPDPMVGSRAGDAPGRRAGGGCLVRRRRADRGSRVDGKPGPVGSRASGDHEGGGEMSDRIRVLLVDDHAIFRAGLAALLGLEPDIDVVGSVGTGEEAVESVRALRPDVVLMDLEMPGMGGLEATRQVLALGTAARVLALTSHGEDESLLPALEAGAHGFVCKTRADEEVTSAIRMVARDRMFLYLAGTRLLLRRAGQAAPPGREGRLEELSRREAEVLALTARGYTSPEAARQMALSPKTVDTYRSRMMRKLGLTCRTELVSFALETGVLAPPGARPRV